VVIRPYVVQQPVTVRGEYIRAGTVIDLDPESELAGEYGYDNLVPLAATQSGDDADHATEGN
jgi:hypothetical protein